MTLTLLKEMFSTQPTPKMRWEPQPESQYESRRAEKRRVAFQKNALSSAQNRAATGMHGSDFSKDDQAAHRPRDILLQAKFAELQSSLAFVQTILCVLCGFLVSVAMVLLNVRQMVTEMKSAASFSREAVYSCENITSVG